MEMLNKFLILKPLLKLISEGKFFRKAFAWFLRIAAALILLGFLYYWLRGWGMVFQIGGAMILFGIIIMLLALVAVYAILNAMLVRADDIDTLPESKDYKVTPIAVIAVKLAGEIAAIVYVFLGICVFLLSLTKQGGMVMSMLPLVKGGSGFMGGLIGLGIAVGTGFLSLIFSYWIAEQIGVLVDIARNTKK